ncbi:MAG TPA: hypothetical protein VMZ22_04285 [Acidimicrobiales bacterium]|nr:hypothetical protein [Acidimicrobiales bacterium]
MLAVVGVVAAVSWSDDSPSRRDASTSRATTTSTTAPTEVLDAQVDNTTTSEAATATTATTTATSAATATTTAGSPAATTTTAAKSGRIYGYSWPSEPNNETTVSLMRGGSVVAERKTDGDGYFEFRDLPAGTYALFRSTKTTNCPTSTTAGEQPNCSSASSRTDSETEVTIGPGGEARADVF